jgi:hypothetical protein
MHTAAQWSAVIAIGEQLAEIDPTPGQAREKVSRPQSSSRRWLGRSALVSAGLAVAIGISESIFIGDDGVYRLV